MGKNEYRPGYGLGGTQAHRDCGNTSLRDPLGILSSRRVPVQWTIQETPQVEKNRKRESAGRPPPYSDHFFGSIPCGICRKQFHPSRPEALLEHIAGHFDMRYVFHRCQQCSINFVTEEDLRRHLISAKRDRDCGYLFEHKQPCTGHHPPRYRGQNESGAESRARYSLMRQSDEARFDFCYRLHSWEELQLHSFYQKQWPQLTGWMNVATQKKARPPRRGINWCLLPFLKPPMSSKSTGSNAPPMMENPVEPQNKTNNIVVSNTDVLGTMLLRAVCTGCFELVYSLLYAGANVHMEDTFGFGIMHYAARYASIDIVRMVARTGPYINKTDNAGMSPLFHAVKIGRAEVVRCFLELGADLKYDNLHLAMLTGDYETIEILLHHWTKSNRALDALDVLLPEAARQRDPMMVEILLEYGARALAKDEAGLTALSIASAAGDRDSVQLLLEYGAVPDNRDKSEWKLFNERSEYRHIAMVDSLYSKRW